MSFKTRLICPHAQAWARHGNALLLVQDDLGRFTICDRFSPLLMNGADLACLLSQMGQINFLVKTGTG